ncbi:MAG: hypothetical protein J6C07_09665 [Lachnospiraceae bacterium]|nr:hypothetical protein [Lachnospiraceae bacterium]
MKKWIFIIVLFIFVAVAEVLFVYAETYAPGEEGYFEFNYTAEVGSTSTKYYFEFSAFGYPIGSSNVVRYYDSNDDLHYVCTLESKEWNSDSEGHFVSCIYEGEATLANDLDIKDIVVCFHYEQDAANLSVSKALSGTLVDSTVIPEITPDIEEPDPEEPTPEITPDPTPTNTPTPTPTPGPILELNAFVNSKDAVAQYRTGGCTPVKSLIEFYEVNTSADILTKINSEQFLSGSGTMRNTMTPGKVYRYKLTYVFQRDGIQYEKFLWSDDLTIVDQELEDYRSNKKITNFRTLMLYVWEEVMSLELPVEGFKIEYKQIFIWTMLAAILIYFFKLWTDK